MARPSKASQEAGLQVRERIIQAAIALVAERGFASVGVREIASRAACTTSMISYHFTSKDGLLEALVQAQMATVRNRLGHVVEDALSPQELVTGIVDTMFEMVDTNEPFFRTVWRDIILVKNHPLHNAVREMEEAHVSAVTSLLTAACERHGKRLSSSPRLLMAELMSTLLFWKLGGPLSTVLLGSDTPASRQELKRALRALFMNAIVNTPSASQGGPS